MWYQTVVMLKKAHTEIGVGRLCMLVGKTRHAYYDKQWCQSRQYEDEEIVVEMLLELKRDIPGAGIPTLYQMLKQPLITHDIKMGRDSIQRLRKRYGLLVKQRKKYVSTTNSYHRFHKYPNKIKDIKPVAPNRIWVADITYIRVGTDFNFLSLLTDIYSRKIVGYCLYATLSKEGPLTALRMALQELDEPCLELIHHSDRGIQYCCDEYTELLGSYDIEISMTNNGDPYENAIAERVNGILKKTFGLSRTFSSSEEAISATKNAVLVYNNRRPHSSVENLTPEKAHLLTGELKRKWSNKRVKNKIAEVCE